MGWSDRDNPPDAYEDDAAAGPATCRGRFRRPPHGSAWVASVKVLIVSRIAAGVSPEELADHLADEAAELRALRDRGVLVEAYSPVGPGAVLIVDAEDGATAAATFESLPLPRAGLVRSEIIELHPLNF